MNALARIADAFAVFAWRFQCFRLSCHVTPRQNVPTIRPTLSFGDRRDRSKRPDWVDALERAVSAAPGDVVLVAHSLGCVLTAHWAAGSARTARVRGALLVAAPQLDRPGMPDDLADFRPVPRQRLPFPSTLVFSTDDPFSDAAWSRAQAQGARGHINAESGLGSWPEGRALIAAWSLQHP